MLIVRRLDVTMISGVKGQARLSLRIIHIESYSNVDTDDVESVHAHTTNLSFVTLSLLGLNETGMGKKQSKQQ